MGQQVGGRTFVRTTAFKRKQDTPLGLLCDQIRCKGDLYGGGAVVNRFLTDRWTIVPEYALTHTGDPFGLRHEHEVKVGTFYVHPRGYSFSIQEDYFHQRGVSRGIQGFFLPAIVDTPVAASVFTTNVSFSYELPRKRGLLSLSVTNLTDRRYAFLADPLALDPRTPKLRAMLSMRVNF